MWEEVYTDDSNPNNNKTNRKTEASIQERKRLPNSISAITAETGARLWALWWGGTNKSNSCVISTDSAAALTALTDLITQLLVSLKDLSGRLLG